MRRIKKIILFVGIPVMAMLGNMEASKMYNKNHWLYGSLSDFQIMINAIMFGMVTLLVMIVIVCLQYVFLHFFELICRKHKQKE